jgi:hypothetical protein
MLKGVFNMATPKAKSYEVAKKPAIRTSMNKSDPLTKTPKELAHLQCLEKALPVKSKITEESLVISYDNGHKKGLFEGTLKGLELAMKACTMMRPTVSANVFTYLEGLLSEVKQDGY